jgi:hypothetical protein
VSSFGRESLFTLKIDVTQLIKCSAHVIDDLQPFVCAFQDCEKATQPFRTHTLWLTHLKAVHSSDTIAATCNLCAEEVTGGHASQLAHTERHLVDIALLILPTNDDAESDDEQTSIVGPKRQDLEGPSATQEEHDEKDNVVGVKRTRKTDQSPCACPFQKMFPYQHDCRPKANINRLK